MQAECALKVGISEEPPKIANAAPKSKIPSLQPRGKQTVTFLTFHQSPTHQRNDEQNIIILWQPTSK